MPKWRVFEIDVQRVNGQLKKVKTTVATFDTKEEAQAFRKTEDPQSIISKGIEEVKRDPGLQVIGPPPSGRGRRLQRERLGRQAIEKAEKGIPISAAERSAARRLTGRDIQTIRETERLQTKTQLEREKARVRQERVQSLTKKIEVRGQRLSSKERFQESLFKRQRAVAKKEITISQDRSLAFPGVLPRRRPIQETIILPQQQVDISTFQKPQRPQRAGTIGKRFRGQVPRLFIDGEISQQDLISLSIQAKEKKRSRQLMGEFGLGAALGAEFIGGVSKAKRALPEAAGFGALSFISPVAAGAVGLVATAVSIPALQQEIGKKGVLRTIASELPTLFLFGAAGGAGARLRTTRIVRETAFDIKLDELLSKDIDPTFTFEKKPFIIKSTTPPAFLQRTLRGDVITAAQQEFKLRGLEKDITEPTTLKELRFFLGQVERAPISRAQAAELDIFRFETEVKILRDIEIGSTGIKKAAGRKERQFQLRESFPTIAQKAAFALQQQPRILPPPTRQINLFDVFRGRKGQAGLIPQQTFPLSDIFGAAFRQFPKPKRLPRIREPEVIAGARRRIKVPSLIGADLSLGQELQLTTQGIKSISDFASDFVQDVFQTPISRQDVFQRQQPLTDLDILQQQKTDLFVAQDLFQQQKVAQQQDQLLVSAQASELLTDPQLLTDPFKDTLQFPKTPGKGKKPKKPKRVRGFLLEGEPSFLPGAAPQGFNVLVREKGKNLKANTKPLTRNRALNLGAEIVDNSAAASFGIKKSKKAAQGFDDLFFFKSNKFRSPKTKSKLPPKQFIEKRGFRIDSPGELAGITAKGVIANRRKAAKNQFLNFRGFGL